MEKLKSMKQVEEKGNESIEKVEKEILIVIDDDKKNWVNLYLLLTNVQKNKLWFPRYHSFTAWLKDFCQKNNIAEDLLWIKKRAGNTYSSYLKNNKDNKQLPPIEEINIPAESLILIGKIAGEDKSKMSELIDNALEGKVTIRELREIHKLLKSKEGNKKSKDDISAPMNELESSNNNIRASDIVTVLKNPIWLDLLDARDKQIKLFKTFVEQDKYRIYTEFPVMTASSKAPRRIDILVAENLTSPEVWKLKFHGIEIKTNYSDLVNDHKYTEYAAFVDFQWLAVPKDLVKIAKRTKFESCGIILIDNGKAEIIEKAQLLAAPMKNEMMNTLLLKVL